MEARLLNTDSAAETDLTLLRLMADGDQHALSMFYQRQARFVFSLALSVVHREADAEEVTQEVFHRVWQHAGSYDESRATLRGWLAMLTRRIAIDRTRSKTYKSREVEVPAAVMGAQSSNGMAIAADNETADQKHLVSHQSRRVHLALQGLEQPYRALIELSYFEGLSHSSIAEKIDAPLGTVKTRLREAIRQMRENLQLETRET